MVPFYIWDLNTVDFGIERGGSETNIPQILREDYSTALQWIIYDINMCSEKKSMKKH